MKISIVIPVYNVEPYIEDCLKSVAEQTYKGDIECIIVDDCTPDGSCAIIERFIKEYNGNIDFILLHHSKNRGLSAARNTGIDAATGEYIYFLDSDDEITPDCLELLTKPLAEKKYDIIIGEYIVDGNKNILPLLLEKEGETLTTEAIRDSYCSVKWYVMAWNKLYNLDYIKKHNLSFKEGLINEDELWTFQIASTAESMYTIKNATYIYKMRESSIMGTINGIRKANAYSTIFQEISKLAKETGILYNKKVFLKLLYYRETVFAIIQNLNTYNEKRKLYLMNYKKMRISPWEAYKNGTITGFTLIKELYNYIPGFLGYWYFRFYNNIKSYIK